mgnify:CR=1 FL=1
MLVSEIMLQQTRVEAVIPFYQAFLARFPDAATLAGAAEEDVLTAWAGLGYYSRARNLRAAARRVASWLIRSAGSASSASANADTPTPRRR